MRRYSILTEAVRAAKGHAQRGTRLASFPLNKKLGACLQLLARGGYIEYQVRDSKFTVTKVTGVQSLKMWDVVPHIITNKNRRKMILTHCPTSYERLIVSTSHGGGRLVFHDQLSQAGGRVIGMLHLR